MADLYVDPEGVNRLYNQLLRASGDAAAAISYVRSNCRIDLTGGAGLIMYFLGPQDHILDQVETSLARLQRLTSGAATEINQAQVMYVNTDHQAATSIDSICTGIKDAVGLRQLLTRTRADAESYRSSFSDADEPTRYLTDPQYAVQVEMWSLNPLADLVSPTAWVRQACISLFGKDPFDYWTSKLAGDWRAFTYAGNAIGRAGAAAHALSANLVTSAGDVSDAWRGNAAEAFQEFDLSLGFHAKNLSDAAHMYYQAYMDTAEVVKKLYDLTAGLVMDFYDYMLIVSGGLAAGTATIETIAGPIAGYSVAAYYSWMAYDLYQVISDFYGNAEDAIKAITATVTGIKTSLSVQDLPDIQPYHHPALT